MISFLQDICFDVCNKTTYGVIALDINITSNNQQ